MRTVTYSAEVADFLCPGLQQMEREGKITQAEVSEFDHWFDGLVEWAQSDLLDSRRGNQRRRTLRVDHRRVAVGPFEIQPREQVRRNARQRAFEIREAPHDAEADAAAARLVSRKRGAIEQPHAQTRTWERPRGGGARRTGADDEHIRIVRRRSRGDHR